MVKPVEDNLEKTIAGEEHPSASTDQHQEETQEREEESHVPHGATSRLSRLLKGGEHLIRRFTFGKCAIL